MGFVRVCVRRAFLSEGAAHYFYRSEERFSRNAETDL